MGLVLVVLALVAARPEADLRTDVENEVENEVVNQAENEALEARAEESSDLNVETKEAEVEEKRDTPAAAATANEAVNAREDWWWRRVHHHHHHHHHWINCGEEVSVEERQARENNAVEIVDARDDWHLVANEKRDELENEAEEEEY